MTAYICKKFPELITYASDGSIIRFHGGKFTATNKAQRDVLDRNLHVTVDGEGTLKSIIKPAVRATPPKTASKTTSKATTKATK